MVKIHIEVKCKCGKLHKFDIEGDWIYEKIRLKCSRCRRYIYVHISCSVTFMKIPKHVLDEFERWLARKGIASATTYRRQLEMFLEGKKKVLNPLSIFDYFNEFCRERNYSYQIHHL